MENPMHLPDWAIGPFEKAAENPVLTPGKEGFDSWTAYNPAVVYAFGEYHMFYRAESKDDQGTVYCGTSRIGYATSRDGRHFEKHGMILDAQDPWELPGGCEDPRIVIVDGVYHLLYTAYSVDGSPVVTMCSAVSTDLKHWEKKGPMFPELHARGQNTKSACVVVNPQLEAVRIDGKYHMFTNEIYATSEDFVHWDTCLFEASEYSGSLHEVCTAITDYQHPGEDDIVLFVAGNLTKLCPERDLFYAITECLLDRHNPLKRIAELKEPVIFADQPFEKSLERLTGDAVRGTIFLDCVFRHNGIWHAYYGASDLQVGAAFCREAKEP